MPPRPASAGMVVLSRVQQASAAEADAVVAHLNRALAGCHCARRFGADVLRKVWDTLTDADFARLDHCGWQQTSYVKLHFDEHEAFTSLYFLEIGRTVEQLRAAAQTLLHDARYGHVLRIKGFIPADGGWVELNAARDAITVQPIPNGAGGSDCHWRGSGQSRHRSSCKTVVNIYSSGINMHPRYFPQQENTGDVVIQSTILLFFRTYVYSSSNTFVQLYSLCTAWAESLWALRAVYSPMTADGISSAFSTSD